MSKKKLGSLHTTLYFHEIRINGLPLAYGAYTEASLYRLLIPEIFKDETEVLYIDSDTVCFGLDISTIVGKLEEKRIAAVVDPFIVISKKQKESLERQGLNSNRYFNSGLMLMNPKELPKNQIEKFIHYSNKSYKLIHPDQDYLNFFYQNEFNEIEEKYNYQVCIYEHRLFYNLEHYYGKLLHYVGKTKPCEGTLSPATLPFWMYSDAFIKQLIENNEIICENYRYIYKIENDINSIKRTLVELNINEN